MLMMLLSPILSFLMAETFGISGLLALMWCAFFQSLYAAKNLETERAKLFANVTVALSSTFRSMSEILTGLSLALHFHIVAELGYGWVALTVFMLTALSMGLSYLMLRYLRVSISESERRVLMLTGNTRGVLGFTLALQNFNPSISAIAVVFNVTHTLLIEPFFNYYLVAAELSYTDQ